MFKNIFSIHRTLSLGVAAAVLLSGVGCGSGGTNPDLVRNERVQDPAVATTAGGVGGKGPKKGAASNKPKYVPADAACVIKGTVNFKGKVPTNPPIPVSEKVCAEHHSTLGGLTQENWVTGKTDEAAGTARLGNVVVYISEGADKFSYDDYNLPPTRINQLGCQYLPHVLALKTDQLLEIESSDSIGHNVHGDPKENTPFNYSQPNKGILDTKPSFGTAELGVVIKCDVHTWMKAYACVFDHPFFAVTKADSKKPDDADGTFEIKVPPGDYTVSVWQEANDFKAVVRPQPIKVSVTKEKPGEANFIYTRK